MDTRLTLSSDRVSLSNAPKLDTPAASTASTSSNNTSVSKPDVNVTLSEQSRQLATEAQARQSIQDLSDSQASSNPLTSNITSAPTSNSNTNFNSVSQSASVVTQYNATPESALGQSISIRA